jgi:hypothetical protein
MDSTILSPSGRVALNCVKAFLASQLALGRECEDKVTQDLDLLRQEMSAAMSKLAAPQRVVLHSIAWDGAADASMATVEGA